MEEQEKSECHKCKKKFEFQKYIGHECIVEQSNPTLTISMPPSVHINDYNKEKEDLKCTFCGIDMVTPKLLEIHMISCLYRNTNCKYCDSLIPSRNNDEQCCSNCSRKTARNSFTRKRIKPPSDSHKKRGINFKLKVARYQENEERTQYTNPKIATDREANTEKQTQIDVNQFYELRHPPSKVCQNSGRILVQQKKDFEEVNAEISSEKFKNKHSRKPNFRTIRRTDEQMKPPAKKSNQLPGKNTPTNKTIKLKLLSDLNPGNDCGLLLQLPSANKTDHLYKCCKCGREFKTVKLVSVHYSSCKSAKFINSEVLLSEVRWVCLICLTLFTETQTLVNHLKNCNIFDKNYEGACERWCKKCNFKCISKYWFRNHDCEKELKNMKTCSVRLNMIKMNVSQDRALMNECKFCDEIFENQYTNSHFETFHPGVSSAENVRKFLVNIHSDPNLKSGSYNNSVVIKIEPESSDYEENASSGFKNSNYLNVNSHPSFNPVLDNISMPPPSVNLPTFQSSVRLPNHQFPSTQVHVPSYTRQEGISNINEQICKCPNRNDASDTKVCLKCLSKLDISEFSQNFKIVPFGLAKIKRENSEESEESNHNAQADFNTATSSTQNGGQGIEIGSGGILDMMSYTSLTPPSSHNGISPPSTPGTLVQSLTNIEPCSASDVSIGSLNDDIAMVPDIAQLDEPRCPDELVHYINDDCSPDIPLIPCDDDQGLFTPMESYKIMHLWDVDDLDCVDAWAVVPSEGNETVEKYICSECIAFSCLDQNSIIKHLIQNHDKKLQFSAMYIIKTENESL